MSEEITIKISVSMVNEEDAKTVNHEIDIKINQNATINDLVEKIKEQKELVEGQKYLMITFNNKILTSNHNTNLFETLKDLKIWDNSILKVDLLPPGEDSKPTQSKHWVNISDDIDIKIRKPDSDYKEISLKKDTKCSKLIELIGNDKDITGDYKYFMLTFQGKIITASDYKEKTLEELNVKDNFVITIGLYNNCLRTECVEIKKSTLEVPKINNNLRNENKKKKKRMMEKIYAKLRKKKLT